ncbi:hypothetical protein RRG08_059515 [Elysia crispata]|uniref:G-protein coupled receptors family 1 profile domain-containing protein n=2 Tax=Elysia crispata TaxID=231223 RepID=A0AAE0YN98_9GAST|nr:hypothetical protein RRG08_059515 [Elysia crispata]
MALAFNNTSTESPMEDGLEQNLADYYDNLYPDSDKIVDVWYWLVGVAGSLIGWLGIICNTLSLGVLTSKAMRTTSNLYLTALAVHDLVFVLASTMFVSMEYFHYGLTGKNDWYYKFVSPSTPFADAFMNTSITGSVYTTILLSADRAIGLTKPLHWPRVCTRRRIMVALMLVLGWSVLLNVPLMVQYRWVDAPPNVTGSIFTVESSYARTYFHEEIYLNIINPIFDSALPLVMIVVANVFIARALHARHRNSGSIRASGGGGVSNTGRDANRVTAQVVFISAMTALTRILRICMFVVMEYHDTIHVNFCPLYCGVLAGLAHFSNICNATVNFFCFCYFGPKYRACFLQKYGCSKCRKIKRRQRFNLYTGGASQRSETSVSSRSTSTSFSTSVHNVIGSAKQPVVFTLSAD